MTAPKVVGWEYLGFREFSNKPEWKPCKPENIEILEKAAHETRRLITTTDAADWLEALAGEWIARTHEVNADGTYVLRTTVSVQLAICADELRARAKELRSSK